MRLLVAGDDLVIGPTPELGWPALLAEQIDATPTVIGLPGASNTRIARSVIRWVEQQETTDDLLVIIQWTDLFREEFMDGDELVTLQQTAGDYDQYSPELQKFWEGYQQLMVEGTLARWKQFCSTIRRVMFYLQNREIPFYMMYGRNHKGKQVSQLFIKENSFRVEQGMFVWGDWFPGFAIEGPVPMEEFLENIKLTDDDLGHWAWAEEVKSQLDQYKILGDA